MTQWVLTKVVNRVWGAIQLKRRGSYSSHRLLALRHFTHTNSLWFSILIVVVTPLPCLALTILLDTVRVSPPQLGVESNYVFVLRFAATVFILIHCLLYQLSTNVGPSLKISSLQLLSTSAIMAVVNAAALVPLGVIIGFPVPFTFQITTPIEWAMLLVMLAMWRRQASTTAILGAVKLTMLQFTATFVYPLYYHVFTSVSESNYVVRTVLWCLFPLLRLGNRQLFYYLSQKAEGTSELIPVIIALNADVASALFITFCVQFSPTLDIALVILVFKVAQAVRSYLDLRSVAKEIQLLRCRGRATPRTLRILPTSLTSTAPTQRKPMLEEVAHIITHGLAKMSTRKMNLRPVKVGVRPSKVLKGTESTLANISSQQEYDHVFRRLLYMTESVLLTEYIDVLIPALYAIYCSATEYLPSRIYYPLFADADRSHLHVTVRNMQLYSSFELFSFVIVCIHTQRLFRFSAMRQLAFVLRHQVAHVQAALILWVVYSTQSSLVHYGVDYTLKFSWLANTALLP